jgi:osmotically-inducible protein OsmY
MADERNWPGDGRNGWDRRYPDNGQRSYGQRAYGREYRDSDYDYSRSPAGRGEYYGSSPLERRDTGGRSWGAGYNGRTDADYGYYGGYGGYGSGRSDRGWSGGDVGYRSGYSGSSNERIGTGGYAGEERGAWDKTKDEVASWFGNDDAERRRRMDEMRSGAGTYRGRGPRGYTRSDDRIREDVNDRLTDDPNLDASEIEVSVNACEVVLSGTVDSRFDKRRAEDIADSVSGVKHVQNNLRVKQSGTTNAFSSASTATSSNRTATGAAT